MSGKKDQGTALRKGFRHRNTNGKTVIGASSASQLVYNGQALLVYVPGLRERTPPFDETALDCVSYRRIKAISCISVEKVDMLASMLSSVDTREKRLCMTGNAPYWTGTKHPI